MNVTSIMAIPWVVPIVCGTIVVLISVLANVIGDCFKSVATTHLKQTMVEQGYSADEIASVLAAKEGMPTKAAASKFT